MAEDALLTAIKTRIPEIHDKQQDDLLNELIIDAKTRVTSYINQDIVATGQPAAYPPDADWIVKELVIIAFNRIGDEGKTASSESGASATWGTADLAQYAPFLDRFRRLRGGSVGVRFI